MEVATDKTLRSIARLAVKQWPIDKVVPYDNNPRKIGAEAVSKVAASIREFGFNAPIGVDEMGVILYGHTRRQAAILLGLKVVPVLVIDGLTEAQKKAYRIADNRVAEESDWDGAKLQLEFGSIADEGGDLLSSGFDADEIAKLSVGLSLEDAPAEQADGASPAGRTPKQARKGNLAEKFGVPPFSVLNARSGWWQERKRAWLALGIQSELGRGEQLTNMGDAATLQRANAIPGGSMMPLEREKLEGGLAMGDAASRLSSYDGAERSINGTSIFDPVLCELVYRWFCPPGGVVLDPFAGGSVRGVIASRLGRAYHGCELRVEQVEANLGQIGLANGPPPAWYCGDSRQLEAFLPSQVIADLLFTCPPYADLEVYSEDERDLSNMSFPDFYAGYQKALEQAANRLKPNRFAVIVIGDARNAEGFYYNLPGITIDLAARAGLRLYNEAILVTSVGSLPIRGAIPFETSRKLGKSHQNVLIFTNGDPHEATKACGPCEWGEVLEELENEVKNPKIGVNPALGLPGVEEMA